MNTITKKKINFRRRKARIKASISQGEKYPRLSVFRSLRNLRAQVIDDIKGETLLAVSEKDLDAKQQKMTNLEKAAILGKILAEKAQEKKIKKVAFDRSGYKYHGRVKALAEAARAAGLEF